MLLSKLNAARIAYGVDRAIAASGADWEHAVASHPTWFQYVSNYVQRGTIPSLGSATRNNAFVAAMSVIKPGIGPDATSRVIASIVISALTHNGAHTDGPFTLTVQCFDALGGLVETPSSLTWISSDPTKATVASPAANGVVTPVAAGTTNVKARLLHTGVQPQIDSSNCVVTLS
jgi:hypothetical protein